MRPPSAAQSRAVAVAPAPRGFPVVACPESIARDTRCLLLTHTSINALTLLCVLSFIAFEVLDLDGSDFQTDPRHATVKPAESEHDDVRRASLTPVTATLVSL